MMITRSFTPLSKYEKHKKYLFDKMKKNHFYQFFLKRKIFRMNKQKILNDELAIKSESFKSYTILEEKMNQFNKENNSYLKLTSNDTKKIYKKGAKDIFCDVIDKYKKRNYIVYNSFFKNIFKRNPLITKNEDLYNYYLSLRSKKDDNKNADKIKEKHILFLKKENDFLLKSHSYFLSKNNKMSISSHKFEKAFSCSNFDINNTIKNEDNGVVNNINNDNTQNFRESIKRKIKENEEIKKLIKKLKKNKGLSTISYTKSNLNTPESKSSFLNNNFNNKNLIKYRSISPSLSDKIVIKKIKLNQISNNKTFSRAKTTNQINNKYLKSSWSSLSESNQKSQKSFNFSKIKKIHHIKINNDKPLEKHHDRNDRNKEIIKELLNEKNHSQFLEKIQPLNLLLFTQKEIEQIIVYYCKSFHDFNDNQIKNVLKAKNNKKDKELLFLINNFITKNNNKKLSINKNKNILKVKKLFNYNIINEVDNKALLLQRALIKNQLNEV